MRSPGIWTQALPLRPRRSCTETRFASTRTTMRFCHATTPRRGQPHYTRQRLDQLSGLYASPVGAEGRIYIVGRNVATCVIRHASAFQVIAVNKLDDCFTA